MCPVYFFFSFLVSVSAADPVGSGAPACRRSLPLQVLRQDGQPPTVGKKGPPSVARAAPPTSPLSPPHAVVVGPARAARAHGGGGAAPRRWSSSPVAATVRRFPPLTPVRYARARSLRFPQWETGPWLAAPCPSALWAGHYRQLSAGRGGVGSQAGTPTRWLFPTAALPRRCCGPICCHQLPHAVDVRSGDARGRTLRRRRAGRRRSLVRQRTQHEAEPRLGRRRAVLS